MSSFMPQEVMPIIVRMLACHSKLTDAVKEEDREEALGSVKELTILNIRLVSMIPRLDQLGARSMTDEEVSQLKKDLSSLLS